ncbi:MAG: YbhB/YbcL family Raf kinase inhibitor-like protein [Notoacmeibacter sp.]|nr:YbhB/YbcL family Raf kinase inhibitor-like protein [Notoacmeibacter sp.]
MELASSDMLDAHPLNAKQVFNGFGCTGGNASPELHWSGAPEGTKSFAVMVHDPDAPTGSGWWHWSVFNIPPSVTALAADAGSGKGLPEGAVQGRTDFGQSAYGGACPPQGDKPHRYVFTVYALKLDAIPLDKEAPAAMVSYFARANALDSATLTATYGR